jgi:hypothetical protein
MKPIELRPEYASIYAREISTIINVFDATIRARMPKCKTEADRIALDYWQVRRNLFVEELCMMRAVEPDPGKMQ